MKRLKDIALGMVIVLACVLLVGYKMGHRTDGTAMKIGGVALTTTAAAVTNADVELDEFRLSNCGAFSFHFTITNAGDTAVASIKLQCKDPITGDWDDHVNKDGTADVYTVLSAVPAGTGHREITGLAVGRTWRFVLIHDATDDPWGVSRMTVEAQ